MVYFSEYFYQNFSDISKSYEDERHICYTAIQKKNKRKYWIYLYRKVYSSNSVDESLDFHQEVEKIINLGHDNISGIKDYGQMNDYFYTLEDYYEYTDIVPFFRTKTISEIVNFIYDLSITVDKMHGQNLIHKNLSSKNIKIYNNDNRIFKLKGYCSDYFSKKIDHFLSVSKMPLSVFYLSPEQTGFIKRKVDLRSNLYSLGVVFYELLTGKLPFLGNSLKNYIYNQLTKLPAKPSDLNKSVSKFLDKVILKLINREPDERYQSIKEFQKDLNEIRKEPDISIKTKLNSRKWHELNLTPDLICRAEHLSVLNAALDRLKQYQSTFIKVIGPPGIGKSKLIMSFLEEKKKKYQITYAYFKCSLTSQNTPNAAAIGLIINLLPQIDREGLKRIKEIFEKKPILFTLFPGIFNETRFKIESDRVSERVIEELNQNINNGFLQLLRELSTQTKNLVLIIDDAHWLDKDSASVIEFVSKNSDNLALEFIVSQRDEASFFDNNQHFQALELLPLNLEQTGMLVNEILGLKLEPGNRLVDEIFNESLGNPFEIIEAVKFLLKEQVFIISEDKIEVSEENLLLVDEKRSAREARLESFSKEEVFILSFLASYGRAFNIYEIYEVLVNPINHELFSQISFDSKGINAGMIFALLDKAEEETFIKSIEFKNVGDYEFYHDKIVEKFYNLLTSSQKDIVHQVYAQALETLYQDQLEERAYLIAYHLNRTSNYDKILKFNYLSYWQALREFSINGALFYINKIVDHLFINQIKTKHTIEAVLDLNRYLQFTGKFQECLEYLEKASILAEEMNWIQQVAEINVQQGIVYYLSNDRNAALKHYDRAMKLSKRSDICIQEKELYYYLSIYNFNRGEVDYSLTYINNYLLYTDQEDFESIVLGHAFRALVLLVKGDFEQADLDNHFVEENIERVKEILTSTQVYQFTAEYYIYRFKKPHKAKDYADKSLQYSRKCDNILYYYFSFISRIKAELFLEKYDETLESIRKIREIMKENRLCVGNDHVTKHEAQAYMYKGDFERAYEIVSAYLEQKIDADNILAILSMQIIKGICLLSFEKFQDSLDCFKKAYENYRNYNTHYYGVSIIFFLIHVQEKVDSLKVLTEEKELLESILAKNPRLSNVLNNDLSILKIIDKVKSNQAFLLRKKIQLTSLNELNSLLLSDNDIKVGLETILQKVLEATGAEKGGFFVRNDQDGEIASIVCNGVEEIEFEIMRKLLSKEKKLASITILNNKSEITRFSENNIDMGVKSLAYIPFHYKKNQTAYLFLCNRFINVLFVPEDLEVLQFFVNQAGLLMNNKLSIKQEYKFPRKLHAKFEITKREEEIIILLLERSKNKEIGKKLFISDSTVKNHIYNIFRKFNIQNRIELEKFIQEYEREK